MAHSLRIKICGVTTPTDAVSVVAAGADLIGVNFALPSRRFITAETARAILAELPPQIEPVGVCVPKSLAEAAERLRDLPRPLTLQWHAPDPPNADAWDGRLMVAFPVGAAADLAAITAYVERCRRGGRLPAALLVDAAAAGQFGGTGRTVPWHLLEDFRPGVPLFLAGGLTPDNVAEAVRRVRPDGVDVAGGVESAPGRKDVERVRRFIDAAREAASRL
jgi:phosphoribosylanthranilate isomerase